MSQRDHCRLRRPRQRLSRRRFVAAGGLLGSAGLFSAGAVAAGQNADLSSEGSERVPASARPDRVEQQPSSEAGGPEIASIAQSPADVMTPSGVLPRLTVDAGLEGRRSECGIGALMAWADRLWLITYVAHKAGTGSGTGLYEIDRDFQLTKRSESVVGTYANRFVHGPTEQLIIGPHLIDTQRNVRTLKDLVDVRLTATMAHLEDPKNKVYFLGMESEFFEADVRTLKVKRLFTLNKELELPKGSRPHYKGAFTAHGRVVVANNTYAEKDSVEGQSTGGRLAEWTGPGQPWTILEPTAFCDVYGTGDSHGGIYATGWDRGSVILKVFAKGIWSTYRLPKGSHCHDHAWYTEWPRIREVETERLLMDMHGLFYELPRQLYGGHPWGVKPIGQHLRQVPDFCSWQGMLVMAGDQAAVAGGNPYVGEPQSNLWFGVTDDLWKLGKPQGWGAPWYESEVDPGAPSDPLLMTGFEHKCLHLTHKADQGVAFTVEVDFLGNGTWVPYTTLEVPANGYVHHEFPPGFSAHWVRLQASEKCVATAQFVYT